MGAAKCSMQMHNPGMEWKARGDNIAESDFPLNAQIN